MCFLGNAAIILALRTLATFILKIQIVRLKKKHNETINTKKNEIAFVVYLSIDDYVKFFTTILSPFPPDDWRVIVIFVNLSAILRNY
ncbi:hypothetical protein C9446_18080 [Providencia heimbachae]|nr:hypothetical protein C9446_18080 [Providencia heimbachae]